MTDVTTETEGSHTLSVWD